MCVSRHQCKVDFMNLTRSYQLQIEPNFHKLEDLLANLKLRKLNRWARSYFANRIIIRAQEEGIHVILVNPAYTSITCSNCNHTDKQSRVNRDTFKCVKCGYILHADINASINIALKGQEKVNKYHSLDKAPVELPLEGGR